MEYPSEGPIDSISTEVSSSISGAKQDADSATSQVALAEPRDDHIVRSNMNLVFKMLFNDSALCQRQIRWFWQACHQGSATTGRRGRMNHWQQTESSFASLPTTDSSSDVIYKPSQRSSISSSQHLNEGLQMSQEEKLGQRNPRKGKGHDPSSSRWSSQRNVSIKHRVAQASAMIRPFYSEPETDINIYYGILLDDQANGRDKAAAISNLIDVFVCLSRSELDKPERLETISKDLPGNVLDGSSLAIQSLFMKLREELGNQPLDLTAVASILPNLSLLGCKTDSCFWKDLSVALWRDLDEQSSQNALHLGGLSLGSQVRLLRTLHVGMENSTLRVQIANDPMIETASDSKRLVFVSRQSLRFHIPEPMLLDYKRIINAWLVAFVQKICFRLDDEVAAPVPLTPEDLASVLCLASKYAADYETRQSIVGYVMKHLDPWKLSNIERLPELLNSFDALGCQMNPDETERWLQAFLQMWSSLGKQHENRKGQRSISGRLNKRHKQTARHIVSWFSAHSLDENLQLTLFETSLEDQFATLEPVFAPERAKYWSRVLRARAEFGNIHSNVCQALVNHCMSMHANSFIQALRGIQMGLIPDHLCQTFLASIARKLPDFNLREVGLLMDTLYSGGFQSITPFAFSNQLSQSIRRNLSAIGNINMSCQDAELVLQVLLKFSSVKLFDFVQTRRNPEFAFPFVGMLCSFTSSFLPYVHTASKLILARNLRALLASPVKAEDLTERSGSPILETAFDYRGNENGPWLIRDKEMQAGKGMVKDIMPTSRSGTGGDSLVDQNLSALLESALKMWSYRAKELGTRYSQDRDDEEKKFMNDDHRFALLNRVVNTSSTRASPVVWKIISGNGKEPLPKERVIRTSASPSSFHVALVELIVSQHLAVMKSLVAARGCPFNDLMGLLYYPLSRFLHLLNAEELLLLGQFFASSKLRPDDRFQRDFLDHLQAKFGDMKLEHLSTLIFQLASCRIEPDPDFLHAACDHISSLAECSVLGGRAGMSRLLARFVYSIAVLEYIPNADHTARLNDLISGSIDSMDHNSAVYLFRSRYNFSFSYDNLFKIERFIDEDSGREVEVQKQREVESSPVERDMWNVTQEILKDLESEDCEVRAEFFPFDLFSHSFIPIQLDFIPKKKSIAGEPSDLSGSWQDAIREVFFKDSLPTEGKLMPKSTASFSLKPWRGKRYCIFADSDRRKIHPVRIHEETGIPGYDGLMDPGMVRHNRKLITMGGGRIFSFPRDQWTALNSGESKKEFFLQTIQYMRTLDEADAVANQESRELLTLPKGVKG